jgi:drug/metabolite transporter (DMT)-like permease
MSKTENNILLFSITLCWAASYVFIKQLPPSLNAYGYLTMTCGIAALLLSAIFWKKFQRITWAAVGKSALLSLLLTLNLLFDKLGIDHLAPSAASVLAASSILIVPILLILMKKMPTRSNLEGAVIVMAGMMVTSGFQLQTLFGVGAVFMLLSAATASVYTIAVDKVTKQEDPLLLSILQMWMSAAFSFALWYLEDPATFAAVEYSRQMLSSVFILAFFAKAYAYVALMYSQKYSDPIRVTIIASTEPVVTLVLAVLIPTAFEEHFTVVSVVGAAIIMVGAIVSGTGFSLKSIKKKGGVLRETKQG